MYELKIEIIPGTGESLTSLKGEEHADYRDQYDQLYRVYNLAALRTTHYYHVTELKPENDRTCRFCKKKAGQVKFENAAHLIPELLGNKTLFSDFECDICNKRFGKYENHLANYLGVVRTMSGVKAKEGIPTFQSPDESFIIQLGEMPNPEKSNGWIIESIGEDKNHFTFSAEQKKITFHAPRHSYRPFAIYKTLLKMALSCIKEDEVQDYRHAFELLPKIKDAGEADNPFYKIRITSHNGPIYTYPTLMLFKKKPEAAKEPFPTHVFCLLYERYMFQINVPYFTHDLWMYDGKRGFVLPKIPPFLDRRFIDFYGKPKITWLGCTTNEKVKGTIQNFSIAFGGYEDTIFDEKGKIKEVRRG